MDGATIVNILEDAHEEASEIFARAADKIIEILIPYIKNIAESTRKDYVRAAIDSLEEVAGEEFWVHNSLAAPDALLDIGDEVVISIPAHLKTEKPAITITNYITNKEIKAPLRKRTFRHIFKYLVLDRD